jgi:hypothetical protein
MLVVQSFGLVAQGLHQAAQNEGRENTVASLQTDRKQQKAKNLQKQQIYPDQIST